MTGSSREDHEKEGPEEEARESPLQYEEEWVEEVERRVREIRSGEVEPIDFGEALEEAHESLDREWIAEVERRVDEVRRGEVKLVPGEEVFRSARERLRRRKELSDEQNAGGAPDGVESRAVQVEVTPRDIVVELEDGTEHSCPLSLFPILGDASPEERQVVEIQDEGSTLHWPEIEEDIAVSNVVQPERMRGISARAALRQIRRNRGLRYLGLSQNEVPSQDSDAFIELVREMRSTFRDEEGAREWLRRRPPAIQGRRPLDLIRSGESGELTELLLALNLGNSL